MDRTKSSWERLAKEGDELFEHLINNYENMLDGEDKVKHFDVLVGFYQHMDDASEIKEKYSFELQRELVPWIKKEFQKNELFKIENWKPFRDPDTYLYMFLGYRNLFQYKHYIFRLSLSSDCDNDDCIYCEPGVNKSNFCLAIYGWKDENHVKIQPTELFTILDDNILPETFWAKKN